MQPPQISLQPGSTNTAAVKQLQDWLVANGYMTQAEVNTGTDDNTTFVSTPGGFKYIGPPIIMTSLVISDPDDADSLVFILEPSSPTYLSGTEDEPAILINPAGGQLFSYLTVPDPPEDGVDQYNPVLGSPGIVSSGLPWEDSLIAHVWVSPQRINFAVNPSFESTTGTMFGWRSNTTMTRVAGGVTTPLRNLLEGSGYCAKLNALGDDIVLESLSIPSQGATPWWSVEAAVAGNGQVRIGMLFWPPAMTEDTPVYVTSGWIDISTTAAISVPVDSGMFRQIKALIPNPETYHEAQFRLEFNGSGAVYVDNVLVDHNEAQLGYFDGNWEMGMPGDYSWYGEDNPTPHNSYSLFYNNRSALDSYLFSTLAPGVNPPSYHSRSWVPEGASVNIHWDNLQVGTTPTWGDTVYRPIVDFANKSEVAVDPDVTITTDSPEIPEHVPLPPPPPEL